MLRPKPGAIADIIERRVLRAGVAGVSDVYLAAFFDTHHEEIVGLVDQAGVPEAFMELPDPPPPTEPIRQEHLMCANCGHVRHRSEGDDHIALQGIWCLGASGLEGGRPFFRWMAPEDAQWAAFRSMAMLRRAHCPVCLGLASVHKGKLYRHVRARLRRDGRGRKPVECEGTGTAIDSSTSPEVRAAVAEREARAKAGYRSVVVERVINDPVPGTIGHPDALRITVGDQSATVWIGLADGTSVHPDDDALWSDLVSDRPKLTRGTVRMSAADADFFLKDAQRIGGGK